MGKQSIKSWILFSLMAAPVICGLKALNVNFKAPPAAFEVFPAANQNNLMEGQPASEMELTKTGLKVLAERLQTDPSEIQVKTA